MTNIIMPSDHEKLAWNLTGVLIQKMIGQIGEDMTFSIILSRVTREARRLYGVEVTQKLLREFIDTMPDDVAHYEKD